MTSGFWECRECISYPCIIWIFDPKLPHPTHCPFDKPYAEWKTNEEWDKIDKERRKQNAIDKKIKKLPSNQRRIE